jgi:hypothetical protein
MATSKRGGEGRGGVIYCGQRRSVSQNASSSNQVLFSWLACWWFDTEHKPPLNFLEMATSKRGGEGRGGVIYCAQHRSVSQNASTSIQVFALLKT